MSTTKGEPFRFQCNTFLVAMSASYAQKQLFQMICGGQWDYLSDLSVRHRPCAILCAPGDPGQTYSA